MKIRLSFVLVLLLSAAMLVLAATGAAPTAEVDSAAPTGQATPGVQAAQAVSTITGVAISPLLGVSAIGAWKYFRTPVRDRPGLPWYAQQWFWVPGLILVGAAFVKDVAGTSLPPLLKKPFDVLELFENKISALIATGAFVPLVVGALYSVSGSDATHWQWATHGLAMIDGAWLRNAIVLPLAMLVFLTVWIVAHVVNVLILISPFGVVDAVLKGLRLALLSSVAATALIHPYVGAAWAILIIVICYFLAGWAFRMTVFGTVFACDLLLFRHRRFLPPQSGAWVFTARRFRELPVRTLGKLIRKDGRLRFRHRAWLLLGEREVILPEGAYVVGRSVLNPQLVLLDSEQGSRIFDFPPRFRTHEQETSDLLNLQGVRDAGMLRASKAVWSRAKELCGLGRPCAGVQSAATGC